jgi:hypothetical protein
LLKNGPTILDKTPTAPAFSPIFIKPNQSVIIPVNGSAISITAIFDALKVASIMALNVTVSPLNKKLKTATTKATKKKPIQI